MAESPSPLRRSSTIPRTRAVSTGRYSLGAHELSTSGPSPSDEILYSSPSAKIFKFELPNSSSSSPILPDLDYPVDAIETLPWELPTERLASIGPLKIETVAGSATFLKSGSVVYPLLKNSQCWCVDQVSRFVFRIRKLTYYRVELPGETEEDKSRVESFKEVLSGIIRYEITPCPFKRGFSVVLPEEAKTPKKKKAWQPKLQPMPAFIPLNLPTDVPLAGSRDLESNGGPVLDVRKATSREQDQEQDQDTDNDPSVATDGEDFMLVPDNMQAHSSAVTPPPQTFESLVAKFQQFQDASPAEEKDHQEYMDDSERMSSLGSYHTCEMDDSISPSDTQYSDPPSPWNEGTTAAPSLAHGEDISDRSPSIPESDPFIDSDNNNMSQIPSEFLPTDLHSTPTQPSFDRHGSIYLSSEEGVGVDEPSSDLRQRLRSNRKRDLSPLPPPSTLYYPSARSPANHLTHTIMKKTCTYVLGPPVQFLMLLLRLAAKVAATRPSPTSPELPDPYSDQDDIGDLSEDDFGIPIPYSSSLKQVNSNSLSVYDSLDEAD
ncbi:hypothetical protein TMEN_8239 [Trichophyton mentagrophytes]|uniref:Inheritance of peroxisomes protein 1 n=1 Tax=Trichophyton interdigitale (strain MR816) TaxID=1215338 RepID=A0A059IWK6_TRIIM|nr:hypothetical protein H101_00265 [Trichophyton interdigitale H6]KDB20000.1 hypothetical protein H109_08024 [Trichophyton interdigitale MR816]GBF65522.1 hypothetical protein TMEN_8239 [Trichophyton mentagrophytes]